MTSLTTVSSSAVALYLSREELSQRGVQDELTGEAARKLVREALIAQGEKPWTDMELELFGDGDALLLLARPGAFKQHCFRFSDFEGMIRAVKACDCDLPSLLTYLEGEYILSIRAGDDAIPGSMYEYGEAEPCSDGLAAYAREHGEIIIESGAIALLREKFN